MPKRTRARGRPEGRTHARAIARDQRPVKRLATRTGARVRPDVCPSDGVTRYRSRYNRRSSAQKVKQDKGFLRAWCFSHIKADAFPSLFLFVIYKLCININII